MHSNDICTHIYVAAAKVKSLSSVRLFTTPWTVAYQASPSMDFPGKNTGVGSHFLLQEIFLTQGLNPGLPHCRQTLYRLSHQGSSVVAAIKSRQSCPTLCDPMDCSPPGSSVHRIFQARVLEWVAIAFSREVLGRAYSFPD